jgi:hypothetical protein
MALPKRPDNFESGTPNSNVDFFIGVLALWLMETHCPVVHISSLVHVVLQVPGEYILV